LTRRDVENGHGSWRTRQTNDGRDQLAVLRRAPSNLEREVSNDALRRRKNVAGVGRLGARCARDEDVRGKMEEASSEQKKETRTDRRLGDHSRPARAVTQIVFTGYWDPYWRRSETLTWCRFFVVAVRSSRDAVRHERRRSIAQGKVSICLLIFLGSFLWLRSDDA